MYYGVIGKPMEIAITDMLKVGQLVTSREWLDHDDGGRRGLVVSIVEVNFSDNSRGHTVKVLWQDTNEVEQMPDWFAAELLEPMPS